MWNARNSRRLAVTAFNRHFGRVQPLLSLHESEGATRSPSMGFTLLVKPGTKMDLF
jgi:hypothetical protein